MSNYNPHKQGRKDALQGKPPFTTHRSSWNQAMYDQSYAGGLLELEAIRPQQKQTAIGHLQAVLSQLPNAEQEARDWLASIGVNP